MNIVCFLQHLTQTQGTHNEVRSHEDDPYEEGNLNSMEFVKNTDVF